MFTRLKDNSEHSPQSIHIPKKIQKDIEEKGFHLYKWISPDEVKLSIERDFLKTLSILGIPLAIISVGVALLTWGNILIFLGTITLGVFGIFLYLLFLSLKRSFLLSKSAFVILTDSSISLGGKIHKLSDISHIKNEIKEVEEIFEEDLFEESQLIHSKKSLGEEVMKKIFGGYNHIFDKIDNIFGRDAMKFLILIIAFYTLYVAVMASVYFIGVFFLLVFGNIFTWLNTQYLLKRGHTVIKINELFGNIDILSDEIKAEKIQLRSFLQEALKNEWKDGLLLEINAGIENINSFSLSAIEQIKELRTTINSSRYKEMFSFAIYNTWIKKQISQPLEQILELLQNTLDTTQKTISEINIQVKETTKIELKSVLKLQLKRLKMQNRDIKKFIPLLEKNIKKLK